VVEPDDDAGGLDLIRPRVLPPPEGRVPIQIIQKVLGHVGIKVTAIPPTPTHFRSPEGRAASSTLESRSSWTE
jgi:hypothetical protein